RRSIFLDEIEARERNIEAGGFGVFEEHEFGCAVALIDFLQTLILADAVFYVDHIVADLEIAEVGEKGGDFGFLALRTRGDEVGFIEEVAGSEDGEMSVGQDEAVGDVGLEERG